MNSSTTLIRQIHPSFVQDGRITSQAFRPTPKDEDMLSTYDGDQIDAKSAWKHYTESLGHVSDGALGVSVSECEALDLKVTSDPESFPEHVLIDFSGHGRKQIEKRAKKLKLHAETRDWLFQP
ncbi:hypothetical protein CA51_13060 [Rosistilla oblonga]|uniref:Uncharacterized protein n=1 Tax=Rosistilla oblonga TaxID=2527990 RepID=A0A518IQV6_9BACT|nr:hypothetical protein [Rosistilla oblonga]QDV11442.1 hypothetical protein CA51_13060 [Rosistilla oblonga]QDV55469.1 hypothetical protein Mal33_14430 [Rosistilla oblonga]